MNHDTKKSKNTSTTRGSSISPLREYLRTFGTSTSPTTLHCVLQKETLSYLCKTISGLEVTALKSSGRSIPHLDQESFLQVRATRQEAPGRLTFRVKSQSMPSRTRKNRKTSRKGTAGSKVNPSSKSRTRRGGKRTGRPRPY